MSQNRGENRRFEIWIAVLDASIMPKPSIQQGEVWFGEPARYTTAAFYLTNLNLDEIKEKLDRMRAIVDSIITDLTRQLEYQGKVPDSVLAILGRMTEKEYTFNVDTRNLPKSFTDRYGTLRHIPPCCFRTNQTRIPCAKPLGSAIDKPPVERKISPAHFTASFCRSSLRSIEEGF